MTSNINNSGNDSKDLEKKKTEVNEPDFSKYLEEAEGLLEKYKSEYNNFVNACNDILIKYYNSLGSNTDTRASKSCIDEKEWTAAFDKANELSGISVHIIGIIKYINTHKDFPKISTSDSNRLINLVNNFTQAILNMEQFRNDFIKKFKKGEPPD